MGICILVVEFKCNGIFVRCCGIGYERSPTEKERKLRERENVSVFSGDLSVFVWAKQIQLRTQMFLRTLNFGTVNKTDNLKKKQTHRHDLAF